MNEQNAHDSGQEVGLDLLDAISTLWKGRWTILAVTGFCVAAGVAYAFLAKDWYRAEVVLVRTESKSMSGALGQLGSVASLAGINLEGLGGESQTPLAVLQSREFARDFINDNRLLTVILADRWNAKTGNWKVSTFKKAPDIRDAVEYFKRRVLDVKEDKKAGVVTLSVTWSDPVVSAQWANELAQRANSKLRNQAMAESERNITYLKNEIVATEVPSLQQYVGRALESEMQKYLMARGSDEFAYRVVDHAFEPKERAWPRRSMIIAVSAFAGMLLSSLLLIVRKTRTLR